MSTDKGNTKTLAERLKAALLAFQGEPVKFASAKLADGTAINIQGDSLAVGVMVSVMTEAGEAPLPDGEYTLEDGTVFEVAGGSVAEVKAPAATAEEGMAQEGSASAAPSPTQIIERIEKEMVFEKVAKIEDLEKQISDLVAKFTAVEEENKALKSDNVKFSKMVTEMSESLIAFGEMPQEQAPKKTEPTSSEKKSESIEEFRARVFNKK